MEQVEKNKIAKIVKRFKEDILEVNLAYTVLEIVTEERINTSSKLDKIDEDIKNEIKSLKYHEVNLDKEDGTNCLSTKVASDGLIMNMRP